MPSGPKKRSAARRRSIGASVGKRLSLDLESVSGSHASDEAGTTPKTSDGANRRLSVSTGTSERPGDQASLNTEEWVRVSNFDIWTPTSTTARSDNDAAAEDSYREVRAQDKDVDWETVSRENAGNSSSAEDAGEAENVMVEYSSGSGHGHGQEHADKVISDSSDKEDDVAKSVSSRSDGGKSSHSSSNSGSSNSTVRSSEAFPKKSDDEERSSSPVVVPSHEDESQESSYAEVTSVDARDNDYHGIVANFPSPGSRGAQSSAIEPFSSSDDQEGENCESFSGVENRDMSCTMEPVSSEEEEEEKYRLFSDVSNVKNLLEQEESSGDVPSRYDSYASFLSSRMNEPESGTHGSSEITDAKTETPWVLEEEHPTRGQLEMEEQEVPEAKEVGPEVERTEQQVVEGVRPEILASDQNLQAGGNNGEEFAESIEPTTPEKASEKSGSENPYTFERSISDEELVEPEYSSPLEGKQGTAQDSSVKSPQVQDVDKSIAKDFQDAPSSNSGVPEPDQHELNQLLEIAHSKEIAKLGKQEENLLAQEEQDLGKGIVVEPLAEVLSATDDPKPLEGGEVKDLQPMVAEEAPLLKDSPTLVVPEFQIEAELKEKAPELFSKESEDELLETEGAGKERQILEGKLSKGDFSSSTSSSSSSSSSSPPSSSSPLDHVLQFNELPTRTEDVTLVSLSSIPDFEIPKSSAEVTKDSGFTSLADDIEESREISRSLEKSEQVAIAPHRKIEEQGMPSRTSSEIGGCCEPVQWLFGNFTRLINPRSVRN